MDTSLVMLLLAFAFLVVVTVITGFDIKRSKKGRVAYGCLVAVYGIAVLVLAVLIGVIIQNSSVEGRVGLCIITCLVATLAFVQKIVYIGYGYKLYFNLDMGDFGYTLLDGVTSMVGRTPDQTVMTFDNEEILEQGASKGFSISMYMGLNYGSTSSNSNGNGYKWNQTNDTITIPLFVRGQVTKTNLEGLGSQIIDKSPVIWLVLDADTPTADVSVPFVPKFVVDFNHTQPTYKINTDGFGENSCKTIDDITARCQFFKDSVTFNAYEDAEDLRIDPSGSASSKRLKHVAFVFEEVFAGTKLKKDYVTKVSVYIGRKLKQTHTFPGTIRISDNRVSLLPKALYTNSNDPLKSTQNPFDSGFLRESRIGFVKYFSYPLSNDQIQKFARRKVPLEITADQAALRKGNNDTDISPSRST